jgi:hypothetical protein
MADSCHPYEVPIQNIPGQNSNPSHCKRQLSATTKSMKDQLDLLVTIDALSIAALAGVVEIIAGIEDIIGSAAGAGALTTVGKT